jgi:hypothetical protein
MKGTKRKHTRKVKGRKKGGMHARRSQMNKLNSSAKKSKRSPTPVATTKPTAKPAVPGSLIGTWVSDRDGLGR